MDDSLSLTLPDPTKVRWRIRRPRPPRHLRWYAFAALEAAFAGLWLAQGEVAWGLEDTGKALLLVGVGRAKARGDEQRAAVMWVGFIALALISWLTPK